MAQLGLFTDREGRPVPEIILLPPQGQLRYWPQWLAAEAAQHWQQLLLATLDWEQKEILLFGKKVKEPRLSAWYGEPDAVYVYSGVPHQPLPWTEALAQLKAQVEAAAGCRFNSVLCNYYRDGQDAMGWHADDEPELGPTPTIASVSFGAERPFRFRKKKAHAEKAEVVLASGSLLLMEGAVQQHWHHAIPKTKKPLPPRLNLTFRWVTARETPQKR